mmetsp:Transcript_44379/g.106625  ORF Transcript_44379/g.106625 Transcript_44379/m.106625 type:complete len:376 (-) Transcript_44379:31-1158(-)
MQHHQQNDNANVHRGAHLLSVRSTDSYEGARDKVAGFINAASRSEVIFTRGATEAINLVAQTWGRTNLGEGDEIILTVMEHHSNLVPWQMLAKERGFSIKFAPLDASESLDLDALKALITPRTKLVALAHVSNTLGCVAPVREIVAAAHAVDALVLLDACQSLPHMPVDVQELGVDFVAASGHKMCGPTGIGFLWGRLALLEAMPPWHGGGEMIRDVYLESSTYAPPPNRFEAGTPAITQAIGLGAAVDYLSGLGMDKVQAYEEQLGAYLYRRMSEVGGLRLYGPDPAEGHARAALVAFTHPAVHSSDLATFLDQDGIMVRAGHHCTQPLHRELGIAGSCRASLYIYNTEAEVDAFVEALQTNLDMFTGMADVGM